MFLTVRIACIHFTLSFFELFSVKFVPYRMNKTEAVNRPFLAPCQTNRSSH